LPKIYTAVTRIDIDLSQPSSIQLDATAQATGTSEKKYETQLGILRSKYVAWDVIKRLHLYDNPEFVGHPISHPFEDAEKVPIGVRVSLTNHFLSDLDVSFERATEISQIQYKSTDPRLAANIANEIAESYIDRNFQTRYATTQKASNWLNGQLEGLRKSVVDADRKFADFQKETGLLEADLHNPTIDMLLQLNTALGKAQAERIVKEDLYRASSSIDPDQLMPASAFPALQSLRSQKAVLDSQYASLTAKYGIAYPKVVQLQSQISQIQTAINREVSRATRQIKVDFVSAQNNEQDLSAAVESQKQKIFAMNQNALQYTILQRQVVSTRSLYEDLVRRLQEAGITSGLSADAIAVIDEALPPVIPSSPRKTLNMEVGSIIGLMLGLGIAVLLEMLDVTVQTVEEVSTQLGLPSLGIIPHEGTAKSARRIIGRHDKEALPQVLYRITKDPRSRFAEAFRTLRSNLLLSSAGSPPKLILVCSSWPSEGKSTTAINLAIVLAQTNKKVLLIDADLRRPSIQRYLNTPTSLIGLSEILSGATYSEDDFVSPEASVPSFRVLTAGKIPPSSSELLMSARMTSLLEEWRRTYDFIVLDSAPILAVSDAAFLASVVDSVVIVARAGKTPRKSLAMLRDTIFRAKGKIAGVLLNDVKSKSEAYYGYYGGKGGAYDGYYSTEN
jgi:capsular exopolysaccharide synthesis family protein